MTRIEFPPGSGWVADYSDAEVDLLRRLASSGSATAAREARLLVDAKVVLGARLVPDEEATFVFLDQPGAAASSPDPVLGARLREAAIARVDNAADAEVRADARRAISVVARQKPEITTDDVWQEMRLRPAEPRMLGPAMRWAANRGIIEHTDRTVLSVLPQNHRRPVRVWTSRFYSRGVPA